MAMIVPATYNLTIVKGADFSFTFDIDINGTILDLTGATIKSEIRKADKKASTLIDTFSAALSVGSETGYDSDITLSLTDIETAALEASEGYYDVLVTGSAGEDNYYLRGRVTIQESITEKS